MRTASRQAGRSCWGILDAPSGMCWAAGATCTLMSRRKAATAATTACTASQPDIPAEDNLLYIAALGTQICDDTSNIDDDSIKRTGCEMLLECCATANSNIV